ncbi:hypothetical protein TFLX_06328 [Thermoflexales bacterium]|nr:hypothetical protein TFLX_06328 [Thermoflexales bacterium]
MPVTYTSRKGLTYTLCQGATKTGKPRYYFAREPKDQVLDQVPDGYAISESVNGIVSLAKDRPSQLHASEIAAVEAQLHKHPKSRNYRLGVKSDRMEIYELVGPDPQTLIAALRRESVLSHGMAERLQTEHDRYGQFTPVLRIILAEPERRTFRVERMCWLGSIDDWIDVEPHGPIEKVVRALIPKLGTDEFFELH